MLRVLAGRSLPDPRPLIGEAMADDIRAVVVDVPILDEIRAIGDRAQKRADEQLEALPEPVREIVRGARSRVDRDVTHWVLYGSWPPGSDSISQK